VIEEQKHGDNPDDQGVLEHVAEQLEAMAGRAEA
jgi:hypothetical protein